MKIIRILKTATHFDDAPMLLFVLADLFYVSTFAEQTEPKKYYTIIEYFFIKILSKCGTLRTIFTSMVLINYEYNKMQPKGSTDWNLSGGHPNWTNQLRRQYIY